jgi:multidrug efflux pump
MSNLSPSFQRPAPVNEANVQLRLVPWGERKNSQMDIVKEITPKLVALPGVRAIAINPPSLGSRGFGQPLQFILGGSDYETLKGWRDTLMAAMSRDPRFVNVDSNFRENKPELRIRIDRQRAADLGLSIDQVGRTLETLFGGRQVNTFVDRGEEYGVIIQGRAEDRATPTDITNVFVRSATTSQFVPLSNVVSFTEAAGPANLNRVDRLRTITVQSSLAPGFTLPEAIDATEKLVKEVLPPQVRINYGGQTREFVESSSTIYYTFLLALLVVFLVLAAQFESWVHPFIIMLAVPLAVTGGLGALVFTGISLNVYSQIGMILLIGLMTKNGILIVEFANQLRSEGRPVRESVFEAAVLRLRPILMTSFATVMGAVPLAIAHGAGAESRLAIGWVIIGGVSFATLLTVFIVPVFYTLLAGFTKPANTIARKVSELESETPAPAPHGHGGAVAPAE